MNKLVVLAGGSGFIGSRLQTLLKEQGYTVRVLTRKPRGAGQFAWDPDSGVMDEAALEGVSAVINLAGAGIADGRWTPARKKDLIDSRVSSARLLREAFQRSGARPAVYVSASAIGFYGNSGEQLMRETDPPVTGGFLSDTCRLWENAADEVATLGIRTVKFRIGVVLDKSGGALKEIARPLYFGLGAYFADGKAWYSWIHRDDLCRALIFALENESLAGVYNAVAPHPERIKPLVKAAARALGRPALFAPVPAFALRLLFGEMADTILFSNLVSAEKLQAAGFRFQFPELEGAMKEIFRS
ncbi:MAG: TIGR01777 family oxidoreductase [Saprospiraceae bacterium]|nr:TIGR01777 family oxidoreductase [Saprospiraceae bacterium]